MKAKAGKTRVDAAAAVDDPWAPCVDILATRENISLLTSVVNFGNLYRGELMYRVIDGTARPREDRGGRSWSPIQYCRWILRLVSPTGLMKEAQRSVWKFRSILGKRELVARLLQGSVVQEIREADAADGTPAAGTVLQDRYYWFQDGPRDCRFTRLAERKYGIDFETSSAATAGATSTTGAKSKGSLYPSHIEVYVADGEPPPRFLRHPSGEVFQKLVPHHKFGGNQLWRYVHRSIDVLDVCETHLPLADASVRSMHLGKWNARWQLLFSSTVVGAEVRPEEIEIMPDKTGAKGASDGNGEISPSLMREIEKRLTALREQESARRQAEQQENCQRMEMDMQQIQIARTAASPECGRPEEPPFPRAKRRRGEKKNLPGLHLPQDVEDGGSDKAGRFGLANGIEEDSAAAEPVEEGACSDNQQESVCLSDDLAGGGDSDFEVDVDPEALDFGEDEDLLPPSDRLLDEESVNDGDDSGGAFASVLDHIARDCDSERVVRDYRPQEQRSSTPKIEGVLQCVQVRIGPARGVLVVNKNLQGRKIVLRSSMVKWGAEAKQNWGAMYGKAAPRAEDKENGVDERKDPHQDDNFPPVVVEDTPADGTLIDIEVTPDGAVTDAPRSTQNTTLNCESVLILEHHIGSAEKAAALFNRLAGRACADFMQSAFAFAEPDEFGRPRKSDFASAAFHGGASFSSTSAVPSVASNIPAAPKQKLQHLFASGLLLETPFAAKLLQNCLAAELSAAARGRHLPVVDSAYFTVQPDLTQTLEPGEFVLLLPGTRSSEEGAEEAEDASGESGQEVEEEKECAAQFLPSGQKLLVMKMPALEAGNMLFGRHAVREKAENIRAQMACANILVCGSIQGSHGDYDGDKFWVCWNADLLAALRDGKFPDAAGAASRESCNQNRKAKAPSTSCCGPEAEISTSARGPPLVAGPGEKISTAPVAAPSSGDGAAPSSDRVIGSNVSVADVFASNRYTDRDWCLWQQKIDLFALPFLRQRLQSPFSRSRYGVGPITRLWIASARANGLEHPKTMELSQLGHKLANAEKDGADIVTLVPSFSSIADEPAAEGLRQGEKAIQKLRMRRDQAKRLSLLDLPRKKLVDTCSLPRCAVESLLDYALLAGTIDTRPELREGRHPPSAGSGLPRIPHLLDPDRAVHRLATAFSFPQQIACAHISNQLDGDGDSDSDSGDEFSSKQHRNLCQYLRDRRKPLEKAAKKTLDLYLKKRPKVLPTEDEVAWGQWNRQQLPSLRQDFEKKARDVFEAGASAQCKNAANVEGLLEAGPARTAAQLYSSSVLCGVAYTEAEREYLEAQRKRGVAAGLEDSAAADEPHAHVEEAGESAGGGDARDGPFRLDLELDADEDDDNCSASAPGQKKSRKTRLAWSRLLNPGRDKKNKQTDAIPVAPEAFHAKNLWSAPFELCFENLTRLAAVCRNVANYYEQEQQTTSNGNYKLVRTPCGIWFGQKTISPEFGSGMGSVEQLADNIAKGIISVWELPPIRCVVLERGRVTIKGRGSEQWLPVESFFVPAGAGAQTSSHQNKESYCPSVVEYYTLDNRRLHAFKLANALLSPPAGGSLLVPVVVLGATGLKNLSEADLDDCRGRFSTCDRGRSILVGKRGAYERYRQAEGNFKYCRSDVAMEEGERVA